MAIAYENSAFFSGTSSTSFSNSFDAKTTANRFMIVETFDAGDITSVKFAGVSLTQKGSKFTNEPYSIWYLYGPASGVNNLVVSTSGSEPGRVVVSVYSSVAQSGFPDASSTVFDSAGALTISCTTTPVAAGSWGILVGALNRSFSSTSHTSRVSGVSGDAQIVDTNGTISGSTNMTITMASSSSCAGVMFTIAPVSGTLHSTTLTDAITNSDTLKKTASRLLTDAISNSDTISKLRTRFATLSDAISNTDALIRTITRVFSEAISNTDSLLKIISRNLTEAISNSDTFSGARTKPLTASEAISVTDAIARTISRAITEGVTNSATFIKTVTRTFTEAITSSDTFTKLRTASAVLTEALSNTDALVRTTARTLSQAITNSDTIAKARLRFATLTDAITNTDTFAHAAVFLLRLTETVALSDLFHAFRDGFDVLWRNVSKSAAGTISNVVKSVTSWKNKDRS